MSVETHEDPTETNIASEQARVDSQGIATDELNDDNRTSQGIATDELNDDNRTSDAAEPSDDGDGDVEIEHVGDENTYLQHVHLPTQTASQAVTLDVRRRTLINVWQRAILEEFYRGGMWSAALQLHHLHAAAAEKSGLDLTVVKVSPSY